MANDLTSGLGLDSFSLGTFADGYPVSDGASGTAGTATAAPDEMDPDNFGAGTRDVDVNLVRPPTVAEFNKSLAEARSDARANPTSYATGPDGYPMVRLQGPDGAMRDYSLAMREDLAGKIPGGSTSNYRDFVAANFNGLDSPAALAAYRTLLTPKPPPATDSSSGLLFDGPGVSLAGASFSDLSQPDGRGGLTLSEAADVGKAVSKSAPPSSWDQFAAFAKQQGNAAMNTLGIANDALMSLIPGTQANKTVSNAMVSFMQDMGTVAGMVHEHPDQAAKLIENAVGKVWSTVVSPGDWGDAALSAAKTLLKPFGDLSDVLAKDPNAVAPGELAMAAFGAATVINPRSVVSGTVSAVRRELVGDVVEDLGRQVSMLSRDPALAQTVARALETHPSALENMGQVDLADRIAEALHGPLKGLTGDELVAGLQTVIDPSLQATVRAAGQLSSTAQQAFPELAAKLKTAPGAFIDKVAPQLDTLLASEGMTPELAAAVKRSLNVAGPSGLETAIGNAQRILSSGHPELLQTLGANRELAGINPEALSKYLAMSEGRDLSSIPEPIRAALKSGPKALDDITSALRTDSQSAAAVAAREAAARTAQVREALNLPPQFPFAGWNLDSLGVISRAGVSDALKADLARGAGPIWNEIKANPAVKNDPAAMQRLLDKVKPTYSGKP